MNEASMLRQLQNGSEDALGWFIDRYTPYVSTVIGNIIGQLMSPADVEEAAADVFVALWTNAGKVKAMSVKSWLGTVARNTAKNKLRELGRDLPLEDDLVPIAAPGPEGEAERREQQRLVTGAVLAMDWPEREIFLRHYYYGQKVKAVAEEMDINPSTVKTHLHRGREKLRRVLAQDTENEKGGIHHAVCENL